MLCPRCRVEMRVQATRQEAFDGKIFAIQDLACRNKKCSEYGNILYTSKQERKEE